MENSIKEVRIRAAEKGRRYLLGDVTREEFIDEFSDEDDKFVMILFDVIEHEPSRKGWFGVSEKGWQHYLDNIRSAIDNLEKSIK